MKLGKITNGNITLVECENGIEVGGIRREEEFYKDGYKKVCLSEKDSPTDIEGWEEYENCIVQTWEREESTSEEEHKEEVEP